jgi:hypothetical protein
LITSKFFKVKNFTLPSPSSKSSSFFGINLLGEEGSFAGGGGRPRLQAFLPSPALGFRICH